MFVVAVDVADASLVIEKVGAHVKQQVIFHAAAIAQVGVESFYIVQVFVHTQIGIVLHNRMAYATVWNFVVKIRDALSAPDFQTAQPERLGTT